MVISTIQVSVSEIFGNLVVSEDKSKVENIFNLMQFVYIIIGTFLSTVAAFLFMPFILLYTSGMTDINYNVPSLAFFIVLYSLFFCLYMPYFTLSNVYGYYKETYLQSIVSGLIALILSFVLSRFFSISLVLLGLIFYYLSSFIYRLFIIQKHITWFKLKKINIRLTLLFLLPIISFYMQQKFFYHVVSWPLFIKEGFLITIITLFIIISYIRIFEFAEIKELKVFATTILLKAKQI
jgi:O-antigen/teichoic acid export membrane protein